MKSHLRAVLTALVIAVIWGYFSDLSKGDTTGFVFRLLFCSGLALVVSLITQGASPKR